MMYADTLLQPNFLLADTGATFMGMPLGKPSSATGTSNEQYGMNKCPFGFGKQ